MRRNWKIFLRILANTLLGFALIFIWSKFINFSQIWQILKTFKPTFLLIFFGVSLVSAVLRGIRFKLLLKNLPLSFKDSINLTFVSQLLSFMIPLRAGELSKSVYLTSQFGTPLSKSVTWVFIDRFLDFFVILTSVIFSLIFIPNQIPVNLFKVMVITLLLFLIIFLIVLKSQTLAKKIVRFLSNYLIFSYIKIRFVSFIENIIDGGSVLKRPLSQLLLLLLISFIATIFDSLIWLVVYNSLGQSISLSRAILGSGLLAFTFLVPAAPGYVGSAEASGLAVFAGVLNFDPNLASAASVVFHILTILALPIFGITALYFLKFDLRLVWKTLKKGK